ncbi:hypothetical protein GCM10027290_43620 [Micromonospora sonneratiae]|uniref:HEAT repeat-containing protein n=1 Tax=Micromonospora sonneratiae TaxID=1184706 RepID=A0ABW3YNL3_9ACTN
MIEALGEVDWTGLTHAYGSADDVPDLIRGLLSPDPKQRSETRHELYSCIAHQGTRYAASAPAVPFLLALAADPATPDRSSLIDFLEFMATGNRRQWTRYPIADERAQGPSFGLATYDAVAKGIPLFVTLLEDSDAELAVPAAQILAVYPEHAQHTAPALDRAAADDDAPVAVVTAALLALGTVAPVGSSAHDGLFLRRLGDSDGTVRWAAALATARLRRPTLLAEALVELCQWADHLADPNHSYSEPWYGIRENLALGELAECDPDGQTERVRRTVDCLLTKVPSSNWHNHLLSVFKYVGLEWCHWQDIIPWADLDPAQRYLVERLCERPDVFADGTAKDCLLWHRLPGTLTDLRAYAGN